MPRTTASKRAITPIAWATPSSLSRPVVSSPRPRRSTDFSLKMVTGLRETPSNTTSRTELEPRSTTAERLVARAACVEGEGSRGLLTACSSILEDPVRTARQRTRHRHQLRLCRRTATRQ